LRIKEQQTRLILHEHDDDDDDDESGGKFGILQGEIIGNYKKKS